MVGTDCDRGPGGHFRTRTVPSKNEGCFRTLHTDARRTGAHVLHRQPIDVLRRGNRGTGYLLRHTSSMHRRPILVPVHAQASETTARRVNQLHRHRATGGASSRLLRRITPKIMNIPKHSEWKEYRQDIPAKIEKVEYPILSARFYKKDVDDTEWSTGLFFINAEEVMTAWGIKAEPHCSNHAVKINGKWSKVQAGCPNAKPINDHGKIIGIEFLVDGELVKFYAK